MAMRTKLHLIKYYYSEMFWMSEYGGPFMRPLYFDFSNDLNALNASE